MNKFVLATLSAFWLGACDSGVPPRNQADTLAQTPPSPSATAAAAVGTAPTPGPLASAAAPSASSADATTPEPLSPSTAPPPITPVQSASLPALPSATPSPQAAAPPVLSSATPAGLPASPFDPERACNQDSDCELVPDDCRHCPPCEGTWRRAVNRVALKRIVKAQRAIACPPIMCPRCSPRPAPPGQPPVTTGYLGDTAKCEARQCVAK